MIKLSDILNEVRPIPHNALRVFLRDNLDERSSMYGIILNGKDSGWVGVIENNVFRTSNIPQIVSAFDKNNIKYIEDSIYRIYVKQYVIVDNPHLNEVQPIRAGALRIHTHPDSDEMYFMIFNDEQSKDQWIGYIDDNKFFVTSDFPEITDALDKENIKYIDSPNSTSEILIKNYVIIKKPLNEIKPVAYNTLKIVSRDNVHPDQEGKMYYIYIGKKFKLQWSGVIRNGVFETSNLMSIRKLLDDNKIKYTIPEDEQHKIYIHKYIIVPDPNINEIAPIRAHSKKFTLKFPSKYTDENGNPVMIKNSTEYQTCINDFITENKRLFQQLEEYESDIIRYGKDVLMNTFDNDEFPMLPRKSYWGILGECVWYYLQSIPNYKTKSYGSGFTNLITKAINEKYIDLDDIQQLTQR